MRIKNVFLFKLKWKIIFHFFFKIYALSDYSLILNKIKRFCAYQERCHKEVITKLKSIYAKNDQIPYFISTLIKENYLNETRYAMQYANGKFRIKNWGKVKIRYNLRQNNITEWNITNALNEINDKEYIKIFNTLFNKLLLKYDNLNYQNKKKKIYDALIYRGWEKEIIFKKLKEV
tara:strand:- start:48418 stop:48945 length:528 start_codon:yes stop_codon:yes gene_type:complete